MFCCVLQPIEGLGRALIASKMLTSAIARKYNLNQAIVQESIGFITILYRSLKAHFYVLRAKHTQLTRIKF